MSRLEGRRRTTSSALMERIARWRWHCCCGFLYVPDIAMTQLSVVKLLFISREGSAHHIAHARPNVVTLDFAKTRCRLGRRAFIIPSLPSTPSFARTTQPHNYTAIVRPLPPSMPPRLPLLTRGFHQPCPLPAQQPPLLPFLYPLLQYASHRSASILSQLSDTKGAYSKRIRVGRGPSSGYGKTSGRGHKGQKQHGKVPAGFNGGQTPDWVVAGTRGEKQRYAYPSSTSLTSD